MANAAPQQPQPKPLPRTQDQLLKLIAQDANDVLTKCVNRCDELNHGKQSREFIFIREDDREGVNNNVDDGRPVFNDCLAVRIQKRVTKYGWFVHREKKLIDAAGGERWADIIITDSEDPAAGTVIAIIECKVVAPVTDSLLRPNDGTMIPVKRGTGRSSHHAHSKIVNPECDMSVIEFVARAQAQALCYATCRFTANGTPLLRFNPLIVSVVAFPIYAFSEGWLKYGEEGSFARVDKVMLGLSTPLSRQLRLVLCEAIVNKALDLSAFGDDDDSVFALRMSDATEVALHVRAQPLTKGFRRAQTLSWDDFIDSSDDDANA